MEFLKRLQYKVNLIPVIAKSDTLTQQEVQRLKNNINKEIEENDIEIYQFPGNYGHYYITWFYGPVPLLVQDTFLTGLRN